ncbi:cupin domain-containing protein [Bosea sp. LjRoot9]
MATIIRDVAQLNRHISPFHKDNLTHAFGRFSERRFSDAWPPRLAASVNNPRIRLATLDGETGWHFNSREDEVFFVHKGRLLMKFRDRDEVIEEGEFILVPRGVERCPTALEKACKVVMLEIDATRRDSQGGKEQRA